MSREGEPYWKLRPPAPTPEQEVCSCAGAPPIMLQAHLSSNPLSCLSCNLEVPPERIGFSAELAERLAFWQTLHDCFYRLWLDSGEFEAWAKAQLKNPASPVNERALALVAELNDLRRAYYWWFQKSEVESGKLHSQCPRCQGQLVERHGRFVCESCSIVVAD